MKLAGPVEVSSAMVWNSTPWACSSTLEVANIGEGVERLGVSVPAGVEGEDVPIEHPLEEPDHDVAVLQDQPVL